MEQEKRIKLYEISEIEIKKCIKNIFPNPLKQRAIRADKTKNGRDSKKA